jgi:hypothetical protein
VQEGDAIDQRRARLEGNALPSNKMKNAWVELPDAEVCVGNSVGILRLPSVACAPQGSLRKTGEEGDPGAALKGRSSTEAPVSARARPRGRSGLSLG